MHLFLVWIPKLEMWSSRWVVYFYRFFQTDFRNSTFYWFWFDSCALQLTIWWPLGEHAVVLSVGWPIAAAHSIFSCITPAFFFAFYTFAFLLYGRASIEKLHFFKFLLKILEFYTKIVYFLIKINILGFNLSLYFRNWQIMRSKNCWIHFTETSIRNRRNLSFLGRLMFPRI